MDEDLTAVVRLAFGGMAAHTIGAAVRIGLPDAVADDGSTVDEVAGRTGVPAPQLRRLLRAVAALGLLAEPEPDRFVPRPVLQALRDGHPSALGAFVRTFTDPTMLAAWARLEESLQTGAPAFDSVFGAPFFTHLAGQPELSASFNAAMRAGTAPIAARFAELVDLGRDATVIDVGGGDGTLLAAVLAANPGLHGTVLDTGPGAERAPATLAEAGVADRADVVTGDFFTAVPPGADAYLLKSIVHDWDDERCATILRHCRDGLAGAGGRVIVLEPILDATVPDVDAPAGSYLSDLNMLVNVGGRERTLADFDALLAAAGLRRSALHPLHGTFHAIEATPA